MQNHAKLRKRGFSSFESSALDHSATLPLLILSAEQRPRRMSIFTVSFCGRRRFYSRDHRKTVRLATTTGVVSLSSRERALLWKNVREWQGEIDRPADHFLKTPVSFLVAATRPSASAQKFFSQAPPPHLGHRRFPRR
jgi:hypothetical protein